LAIKVRKENKELEEVYTKTEIDNQTVGTSKLEDNAVTTKKIVDKSITTGKLADSSITTPKIADGNVTTNKIADGNVTTEKINNNAITTEKIADSNITTNKIADSNVTTPKIADSSITTQKINNKSVTTEKIADKSITAEKLAEGAIPAGVTHTSVSKTINYDNGATAQINLDRYTTGDDDGGIVVYRIHFECSAGFSDSDVDEDTQIITTDKTFTPSHGVIHLKDQCYFADEGMVNVHLQLRGATSSYDGVLLRMYLVETDLDEEVTFTGAYYGTPKNQI
jgi:hypothetical protein